MIEIGIKYIEETLEKSILPLIFDPNLYSFEEMYGTDDLINDTSKSITYSSLMLYLSSKIKKSSSQIYFHLNNTKTNIEFIEALLPLV